MNELKENQSEGISYDVVESHKPIVVAVDDEKLMLDVYRGALEEFCSVHLFDNAKDAIPFIMQHPVAVLLVDRRMPQMGGDELCGYLRSQPKTQDLPIIVVSGLKDIDELAEMMAKRSIETYHTKPIVLDRLQRDVKFYLKKHSKPKKQTSALLTS